MVANENLPGIIFIGIICTTILWNACTINVEAGNVGIWQTWGKVSPDPVAPGLKFRVPFVHTIYQMNVQVNAMDVVASCFSADLQIVDTKIQLQYHMNSGLAPKMYQKIGMRFSDWEGDHTVETAILAPGLQESIKASTTMYRVVFKNVRFRGLEQQRQFLISGHFREKIEFSGWTRRTDFRIRVGGPK